jgi:hypothetical protein
LKIVTWNDILLPGEPVLRWDEAETDEERQPHQAVPAT